VEETGGELVNESPDKMSVALTRIVDNVTASYLIAYMPTNPVQDGKKRRIRIQPSEAVEKREGKVVILSRRSYKMAKSGASVGASTK
jgi:hypothetical protein